MQKHDLLYDNPSQYKKKKMGFGYSHYLMVICIKMLINIQKNYNLWLINVIYG